LAIVGERRVDAVISDILMPGKSGMDLLVDLKMKYADIPVILITGHSGRFSAQDAIASGADGFLAKPFNNLDIVFSIRSALQRYRRFPVHQRRVRSFSAAASAQ
jgi:two-component system C4-dicarboxylate transport response regulator DctD